MEADEIQAKSFKVWGVVGMGEKQDGERIFLGHELFDILWANIGKLGNHEVVCKDHHLQKKFNALLANVKMSWVEILYNAVEDCFGYSMDFNQSESILATLLKLFVWNFFEPVLVAKHCSEILGPIFQNIAISFNIAISV